MIPVLISGCLLVLLLVLLYRYVELSHALAGRSCRDGDYVSAMTGFVDVFEGYAGAHGREMADECARLGRLSGLPEATLFSLRMSALLHDCGELSLPKELFRAARTLSPEEWDLIRSHPLISELTIRKSVEAGDEVPSIVRWHHERWDGCGYPDRLREAEIPLTSRILALADAVSAMQNDRPFRKARTPAEIREEVRRMAGFQFDPQLVELYLKHLPGTGS